MVHCAIHQSRAFDEIVRAFAMGVEKQGHDVTVINACTEIGKSLTSFGYIAVGTVPSSFMSKMVPNILQNFLRSAGMLGGKRCYAFVSGNGLRKSRLLASLMNSMEAEGMFLKKSDILNKIEEARAVGFKLHVDESAK